MEPRPQWTFKTAVAHLRETGLGTKADALEAQFPASKTGWSGYARGILQLGEILWGRP